MAVILCAPMASALVLRLAVPLARVPVPNTVAPSLKVMLPVALEGVRLAVRVRLWPSSIELALAVKVKVAVAGFFGAGVLAFGVTGAEGSDGDKGALSFLGVTTN